MTTESMDGVALAADTLSEVTQDVAESFAAMGIPELILHAFDIVSAHQVSFRADDAIARAVLERIFPQAEPAADPWDELLRLSVQAPETRGTHWR